MFFTLSSAAQVNHTVENIGARQLHTLMERILEEVAAAGLR